MSTAVVDFNGWRVFVNDAIEPGKPVMLRDFGIGMHTLDWLRLKDPDMTLPEYAAAAARVRFDRLWKKRHVGAEVTRAWRCVEEARS
jgi:hypothetical protein